jgi:hypothetical protein
MVMSVQNERDVRAVLVREKYFTLRPKPLERWLWQQGLPQAAERVFWLHWEEGMRRGDWCSELALKVVARECCVDSSTVTRAYQILKKLELIRREDPGRDPSMPFQQAIAITEVRIPKELVCSLNQSPNRSRIRPTEFKGRQGGEGAAPQQVSPEAPIASEASAAVVAPPAAALTRAESSALMSKLSAHERSEFFLASRDRRTAMPFDDGTALSPEERGRVLAILGVVSSETPKVADKPASVAAARAPAAYAKPRKLSPLDAARLRKSILQLTPAAVGGEIFRQVLWSMEEGALRRFDSRLAANIALKKIREGAWSRPNRMPPNWMRGAAAEACSAA